ncbi:MAG: hypothetical protein JWN64_36 [Parcubacteria group bacterium]|nr:hypothetical protein [Parcubacteria group bacterium]
MKIFNNNIECAPQNPIKTGIFAVLGVVAMGTALSFGLGYTQPITTHADVMVSPVTVTGTIAATSPATTLLTTLLTTTITPTTVATLLITPPPANVNNDPASTPPDSGDTEVTPVYVAPEPDADKDVSPCCNPDSPIGGGIPTVSPVLVNQTPDVDTDVSPCCNPGTPSEVPTVSPVLVNQTPDVDTDVSPCCNPNTPIVPITTYVPPPDVSPCCSVTTPPTTTTVPPVNPPVNPPIVPPTPAKCVFLTASVTDINPGDAVTLSWKTEAATSITIDNGVGSVTPVDAGSVIVHPLVDTTYTATVTGATGSVNCQAPVRIIRNQNSAVCVALTASATDINPGDAVTLTWQTRNATSISIDHGIGSVTPVAQGSVVVNPLVDTVYIATVTGATGSVNCQAPVRIRVPQPAVCIALTATPNEINPGDAVTLAWQTQDATSITIDQGVGSVTPVAAGSTIVHPLVDTTYTATVTGATGSVNCQAPVKIKTTHIDQGPACVQLTASATKINKGDNVILSWVTSNAGSISIDQGVGSVTPVPSGSVTVNPTEDTTYTATVPGAAFNQACQVKVVIDTDTTCTSNCGGGGGGGHRHGGSPKPKVTLSTEQPLGFVYLSQVPYTGFDLGPWGTAVYWIVLILWSAALAYLVLFNGIPFIFARAKKVGGSVKEALQMPPAIGQTLKNEAHGPSHDESREHEPAAHVAPQTMHSAPEAPVAPAAAGYSAYQGFRSFGGDTLSIDDIVKGLARYNDSVAKEEAPAPAAPVEKPAYAVYEDIATPAPVAIPAPVQKAEVPAAPVHAEVPHFLEALLGGDRDTVFNTIRTMTRNGEDSETFLTHAVCALDDAYRSRIDGTPCHPEVARITADCAPSFLERMVTSLATVVDGSYSAGVTGVKLALTRALAVANG